jgi:hypothetical protein
MTATALPTGVHTPTETPGPSETPAGESSETPLPPTPPITPGDEAQFEAYVRDHYNTIAGSR